MDTTATAGYSRAVTYRDGSLVRVSVRRTDADAYPSGWRYMLHHGRLAAGPETLGDGTIRHYDNAHEATMSRDVLHVTVEPDDGELYERGRAAIDRLARGESVTEPPTVSFASPDQLTDVFDANTYELLRVIRDHHPESIRGTARLVERDVKNVHERLTTLEGLGVIRFEDTGRARRPVFPYDGLVVTPLPTADGEESVVSS